MTNPRRPQDAWRQAQASNRPQPGGKKSGLAKWFVAAFVVLALVGVIVGWLSQLPGKPPDPLLLAIPVTQYTHPDWSPNPWAEADAQAFRDRFGGDSAQAFQIQEKARILRELNQLADDSRGKNKGRPVVVYLSLLGVATDTGVSLIPGDGNPGDTNSWFTLDEILQPLRKTDAKRLLILDVRPVRSARSVLPAEDVNEVLSASLAKLDQNGDLPFFVLTANTPANGPLGFRSLKKTAFGLALAHAAGGAADGWSDSDHKDGRVSVKELADATRDFTIHITTKANAPVQIPKLFGKGEDFHVIPVVKEKAADLPALPDIEPDPAWLASAWKLRDQLIEDKIHLTAPRLVQQLTVAIARAEAQYLAGLDPNAVQATLQSVLTEVTILHPKFKRIGQPITNIPRAFTDPTATTKVRAVESALQPALERIRNPEGVKPDELLAAMQAIWSKPPDTEPYHVVAFVIWEFAQSLKNGTPQQWKQLVTFARGFRPNLRHPEIAFLEVLSNLEPGHAQRIQEFKGTENALLRAMSAREECLVDAAPFAEWLIAPLTDEGTPLASATGLLAKTDARFREVLATLTYLEAEKKDLELASQQLETIITDYRLVRETAKSLTAAKLEYEETRAVLLDLATAYPDELGPDPASIQTAWGRIVENMKQLQEKLQPPKEPSSPDLTGLNRETAAVKEARQKLFDFLKPPSQILPTNAAMVFRWPQWKAKKRAEMLAALQQSERAAYSAIATTWPTKPLAQTPAAPPTAAPAILASSLLDLRRLTDLLQLADGPKAKELDQEVRKLGNKPMTADLFRVTRMVRAAVCDDLPKKFSAMTGKESPRIGWAIHAHDLSALPRMGLNYDPNPERPDDLRRRVAFQKWLGVSRYKQDATTLHREGKKDISKAARVFAQTLDQLGRDHLDWSP